MSSTVKKLSKDLEVDSTSYDMFTEVDTAKESKEKEELRWFTLYHHLPADNILYHYRTHVLSLSHFIYVYIIYQFR